MKQISTLKKGLFITLFKVISPVIILLCISKTSGAYEKQFFAAGTAGINFNKIQVNGSLPVVLTPLKGFYSKGVSHLTWSSLQESNSSHFEIERSSDGITYFQVGKVTAQSTSDKEVDYSFDDLKSNAGLNYYRFKLVDKDKQFQYSNVTVVNVNIKGVDITGIYPGPFIDKINVTISSEVQAIGKVDLFDNNGKLLISQQAVLSKGVTNLAIDKLDNLGKGLYIIKVQAGETIVVKKIMK